MILINEVYPKALYNRGIDDNHISNGGIDMVFKSMDKIGDIVARFPNASDIFKAYKVDFCCGGNRPLLEAIKEQNIDEEKLISELNNAYEKAMSLKNEDIDWTKESFSKLIDYVVNTHHSYLQVELPNLSELTAKILRAHGENHPELSKVFKLFHSLKMELEQHLIKEEEILFPAIKDYEVNPNSELYEKAVKTIKETEEEHEGAGDILKELRKITKDYEVPSDGCRTYLVAYKKLEELEGDLFQHIHLENNILFPRFQNVRG